MKNPRLMHRIVGAGYAVLGIALLATGMRPAAAVFLAIGVCWFAISFTRFADKSSATK
jgi:hypothetical protein